MSFFLKQGIPFLCPLIQRQAAENAPQGFTAGIAVSSSRAFIIHVPNNDPGLPARGI
jgi:hypothetical protein